MPGAVNAEEIAINKNHLEMVRFHSDKDEGFKKISLILGLMVSEAGPQIDNKWRRHDAQMNPEPIGAIHRPEQTGVVRRETSVMLGIEPPPVRLTVNRETSLILGIAPRQFG